MRGRWRDGLKLFRRDETIKFRGSFKTYPKQINRQTIKAALNNPTFLTEASLELLIDYDVNDYNYEDDLDKEDSCYDPFWFDELKPLDDEYHLNEDSCYDDLGYYSTSDLKNDQDLKVSNFNSEAVNE